MGPSFQLKALQRSLLPISGRNKQTKLLHYGEGLSLQISGLGTEAEFAQVSVRVYLENE